MSDARRQGFEPVKSGLGGLFTGSGGAAAAGGGDDDLAYQRVSGSGAAPRGAVAAKKGSAAAPAAAAAPATTFLLTTAVQGVFYLNPATRAYEARGAGTIGCVIAGAGVSYSLILYDAQKVTLLSAPVNGKVGRPRAAIYRGPAAAAASPAELPAPPSHALARSLARAAALARAAFALPPAAAPAPTAAAAPPPPPQLKVELNVSSSGAYLSVAPSPGELWSILCASSAQAADIVRGVTVTAAHAAVHGGGAPLEVGGTFAVAPAGEGSAAAAAAAASGDTVALGFALFSLATIPSAKPTDALTAPPLFSNAAAAAAALVDSHIVVVGESERGLPRLVAGLRAGDRRLQVVSLLDLLAARDVEPARLGSAAAAAVAAAQAADRPLYVLAELSVLAVKPPPAAPQPAAPPPPVH